MRLLLAAARSCRSISSDDPVVIDRRAAAIARQQRRGHARDAGQQDLVDRLFQHVQAGDADDRIDMAADDDLEDDRRAFGDEHLVAQVLGLGLEVGDGAGPALAAIEAELVVVGGAALGVLEAVRQQQQAALEVDGLTCSRQNSLVEAHHREAEVLLAQVHGAQQRPPPSPAGRLGERPGAVEAFAEAGGLGADAVAQLARLGDDLEMGGARLGLLGGASLDGGTHQAGSLQAGGREIACGLSEGSQEIIGKRRANCQGAGKFPRLMESTPRR